MGTVDTGCDFSSTEAPATLLWRNTGKWTWETQGFGSTEMKLSTISHPPIQVSENAFSWDMARNPPPLATGVDKDLTLPVT